MFLIRVLAIFPNQNPKKPDLLRAKTRTQKNPERWNSIKSDIENFAKKDTFWIFETLKTQKNPNLKEAIKLEPEEIQTQSSSIPHIRENGRPFETQYFLLILAKPYCVLV